MEQQPLTRAEFTEALLGVRSRYWDGHPFHVRLHAGGATVDDIRRWVANRWYYQNRLARKNAAIIANCPLAGGSSTDGRILTGGGFRTTGTTTGMGVTAGEAG